MKTLIVLAGLVSVEKVDLSVEIADYFGEMGHPVTILDNISRLSISSELVYRSTLVQHAGDILPALADRLNALESDAHHNVVVFAVNENSAPDDLFIALDALEGWKIISLALIDLRTCDCFPHIRNLLEDYADIVVNLPYDKNEVFSAIKFALDSVN